MESSRTPLPARKPLHTVEEGSLFFYLGGTGGLLVPAHDTPTTRFSAKVGKLIAYALQRGTIFTTNINFKLTKFDSPDTPPILRANFTELADLLAPNKDNQFFVDWPGDLGITAWENTMNKLFQQIIGMIEARRSDAPLHIYMIGHSHGGQIIQRLTKRFEELQKDNPRFPKVIFHVTTIEMPISIVPPLLMSQANTPDWLHFHTESLVAKFGSLMMQAEVLLGDKTIYSPAAVIALTSLIIQTLENNYTRRLEVAFNLETYDDLDATLPPGWKTIPIMLAFFRDHHNGPVKDPVVAKFVCDNIYEWMLASQQRSLGLAPALEPPRPSLMR
jgi:hypothetical protein